MRTAAADDLIECFTDVFFGGVGVFFQKCRRGHDHAVQAIAALSSLGIEEGLLDRMELAVFGQPFQRGDFPTLKALAGAEAGWFGFGVDKHHAGATLMKATAIFCAIDRELISQDIEQRFFRIAGDDFRLSVYTQGNSLGHDFSRLTDKLENVLLKSNFG